MLDRPVVREDTAHASSTAPADATKRVRKVAFHVLPDQVLVKFEPGTPQHVIDATLARTRVAPKTVVRGIGVRVIDVEPEDREAVLAAFKASPAVEYAEREVAMEAVDVAPNDPRWSSQWGPRVVSAPKAWSTSRGSSDVVVAIVDTGVDPRQPDLVGALVPVYDLVNNDANPEDDNGHGTAVAGVVAARTNNAEGQAGLCWTCSLMPVKALDASGSGSTASIAKAIVWAADNGADVINLSLGGPGTSQTLTDAVAYAASKGVLMFGAAGNNGSSTPFYPAAYSQVLGVAATDQNDALYSWSNFGTWVPIAAPGCNSAPRIGAGYGEFCGTSSATPVVSGLAALALAAKPGASVNAVYEAIKGTTKPIGSAVKFGRVDATGTLFALGTMAPEERTTTATFRGTLTADRRSRSYSRLVGSGPLSLELTTPKSTKLTLEVVNPAGTIVASRSGATPLAISRTVRAGTFRYVVRGRSLVKTRFTLVATYPNP